MIVEVLAVLALLGGGSLAVRAAGVRGFGVPAVGFAVGVALHTALTALVGVATLPGGSWLPAALTLLAPAIWWARCRRNGEDVGLSLPWAGAVIAGAVGLVAVFRASNLVNVTPDSFRYMTTTGLLGQGRLDEASAFLLESRLLTVPAMHAPATLIDELYLRSITPLLAIACLGTLAWLVRTGLHGRVFAPSAQVAALLAVVLLATNNRFVFHGFYVNGHLALALWFLLLAGVAWLLLSGADLTGLRPARLVAIIVSLSPAIVLTRPDAGLMALLIALPFVLAPGVSRSWRFALLLALGSSMTAWQGYLAVAYARESTPTPTSVPGLLAVGLAAIAAAVVVRQVGTGWLPRRTLGLVEGAMWAAVVVFAAFGPRLLYNSFRATAENVLWDGGWGASLMVLAVLVAGVLLLTWTPGQAALRFPLTMFVPLAVLLAYLREGAYRVGPGDSLNRMLVQFLPLAILFVISTLASNQVGRRRTPNREPADASIGAS